MEEENVLFSEAFNDKKNDNEWNIFNLFLKKIKNDSNIYKNKDAYFINEIYSEVLKKQDKYFIKDKLIQND